MSGAMLLAAFLLQFLPLGSGYPTGAPSSACADMTPHHGGVQPQPFPAPYTLYISNHTFRVDEPVTGYGSQNKRRMFRNKNKIKVKGLENTEPVFDRRKLPGCQLTIRGPNYTGVLLRAQSGNRAEALGAWQPPPNNTKYLPCSGNAHGAITHSNVNTKDNNTVYTWTPPKGVNNFHFVATVAQEKTVFWVNIESELLTREDTGLPAGSPPLWNGAAVRVLATILLLTLLNSS